MSHRFGSSQRLDRSLSTQEPSKLPADSAELRSQGESTTIRGREVPPRSGSKPRHAPTWTLLLSARKRSEIDRKCLTDPTQLERSNGSTSFDLVPALFRQLSPAGSISNRCPEGSPPLSDVFSQGDDIASSSTEVLGSYYTTPVRRSQAARPCWRGRGIVRSVRDGWAEKSGQSRPRGNTVGLHGAR